MWIRIVSDADPDPDQDRHHIGNSDSDPDRYQKDADPQHCLKQSL
jgi:hypothetical protein